MFTLRAGTLVDCLNLAGRVAERHARAIAVQAHCSELIAFEDAQGVACVLGFYPLAPVRGVARFELFMMLRPKISSAAVLFTVRLARSTFEIMAQNGPIEVVAHVAEGWQPGRRLCALIGMRRHASGPIGMERYGVEMRHVEVG